MGVILVMVAALLPATIVAASTRVEVNLKLVGGVAGLVLLGVEAWSIALVRRARRRDRSVPRWFEGMGVAMECSIPTAAVLAHVELGTVAPFTALTLPPILVYGALIALTTLRLRPGLCVWAGAVSAGGYASVLAYVALWRGQWPPVGAWPRVGYFMAPLLIFACGLTAAWVAREIRSHVEAALDEAETKRRIERVEQDLGVARTIQQALLPRNPPSVPGFDIAAWNRPADQTGGDYFDWQVLPDGNWIVTLADVSGHGVGPALVTAACRAYVRASSAHHQDLVSLATRVNRLLCDDLPDGRFVTMAAVLIDPRGGPLAVLSAGHGPIVLYLGATGAVRPIAAHGLPLAVDNDFHIGPAQRIDMAPGDVLALVTDGLVEWARPGADGRREEFGVERLGASLARYAARSAAGIVEAVARDARDFAGGVPQQDDVTIVVIRRST